MGKGKYCQMMIPFMLKCTIRFRGNLGCFKRHCFKDKFTLSSSNRPKTLLSSDDRKDFFTNPRRLMTDPFCFGGRKDNLNKYM